MDRPQTLGSGLQTLQTATRAATARPDIPRELEAMGVGKFGWEWGRRPSLRDGSGPTGAAVVSPQGHAGAWTEEK